MSQASSRIEPVRVHTHLRSSEWQTLWFALTKSKWAALALVPSEPEISLLFAAKALADVGRLHGVTKVHCINGEGIYLADTTKLTDGVRETIGRGEMAIIAVDSPIENQASIPIARAADALLLGVPLGGGFDPAERTIDLIGRERFIGSIAIEPPRRKR